MVIYSGPDGQPGYHEADEIGQAITYVERLRNNEGVEQARIFRMEEVGFEFRPYYKVEIPETSSTASTTSTYEKGTKELSAIQRKASAAATAVESKVDTERGRPDLSHLPPPPPPPALTGESRSSIWDDDGVGTDPAVPGETTIDDDAVTSGTPRRGLFGR
jgi:hypothetical protein